MHATAKNDLRKADLATEAELVAEAGLPKALAAGESARARGEARAAVAPAGAAGSLAGSLSKVRAVVDPILVAHAVDLVDLAWVTERAGRTLRVTIERVPAGVASGEHLEAGAVTEEGMADEELVGFGVSLEDCAEVSRDLSAALDVADVIQHNYVLEVSSPGLDRPLRHVADFRRFVGRLAKVKLREPAPDGQRVLRGALRSVETGASDPDAVITVEVDKKPIRVRYANVESANLVYELPTQPKPNARPGKGRSSQKGGSSVGGAPKGGPSRGGASKAQSRSNKQGAPRGGPKR